VAMASSVLSEYPFANCKIFKSGSYHNCRPVRIVELRSLLAAFTIISVTSGIGKVGFGMFRP
jgi:hypothetical protein